LELAASSSGSPKKMLEASLSTKQLTLPLFLSKFFHESKTIIQLSIAFLSVSQSDFVKKKIVQMHEKNTI